MSKNSKSGDRYIISLRVTLAQGILAKVRKKVLFVLQSEIRWMKLYPNLKKVQKILNLPNSNHYEIIFRVQAQWIEVLLKVCFILVLFTKTLLFKVQGVPSENNSFQMHCVPETFNMWSLGLTLLKFDHFAATQLRILPTLQKMAISNCTFSN